MIAINFAVRPFQAMKQLRQIISALHFQSPFFSYFVAVCWDLTMSNRVSRKRRLWKVFWTFWLNIEMKETRLPVSPTSATISRTTPLQKGASKVQLGLQMISQIVILLASGANILAPILTMTEWFYWTQTFWGPQETKKSGLCKIWAP